MVRQIRQHLAKRPETEALQFLVAEFGQLNSRDAGIDDTIYTAESALSSGVLCVRIIRGFVAQVYWESSL